MKPDKLKHLSFGLVAGAVACLIGGLWAAAAVGLVLGVGKELWDAQHPPHVADPWDAVATLAGAVLGGLAVWMVR